MNKKTDKARSELLSLLNQRKSWELPAYRRPVMSLTLMFRVQEAVKCVGKLDNSNPFAARRAHLYLSQGYCLPSEVLKDCSTQTVLRSKEPKGGDRVELLKAKRLAEEAQRKQDADKAWNQFHSAQYLVDKAAA